jgi:hypothetical protein
MAHTPYKYMYILRKKTSVKYVNRPSTLSRLADWRGQELVRLLRPRSLEGPGGGSGTTKLAGQPRLRPRGRARHLLLHRQAGGQGTASKCALPSGVEDFLLYILFAATYRF